MGSGCLARVARNPTVGPGFFSTMARMRRLLPRMGVAALVGVTTAAIVVVAALAIRPDASAGGSPVPLLPDLKELPPADISVCQNPPDASASVPGKCPGDSLSDHQARWQLNFSSAVDNVGRGPVIVDGSKSNPDSSVAMAASQAVRLSNGRIVTGYRRNVGSIYFDRPHSHWHLRDFELYELHRMADYAPVGPSQKSGFCLGDRYNSDYALRLPGEPLASDPAHRMLDGDCGLMDLANKERYTSIREGINPGWGDNYDAYVEGQFIAIDPATVPSGDYVITHRVNSTRANASTHPLVESDYTNDAASTAVHIKWPSDPTGVPRITGTGGHADPQTCPDTERCDPSRWPSDGNPPTVKGGAGVGQTLTCENGTWSGRPTRFRYQWSIDLGNDSNPIPGATGRTLTLTKGLLRRKVFCYALAINRYGTGLSSSDSRAVRRVRLKVSSAGVRPGTLSGRRTVALRFRTTVGGPARIRIQREGGPTVATLRRSVRDGFNTVLLSRRVSSRGLAAGRYRAVVTVTDAYGARASAAARFSVAR